MIQKVFLEIISRKILRCGDFEFQCIFKKSGSLYSLDNFCLRPQTSKLTKKIVASATEKRTNYIIAHFSKFENN